MKKVGVLQIILGIIALLVFVLNLFDLSMESTDVAILSLGIFAIITGYNNLKNKR